jgi:hypothetical protein
MGFSFFFFFALTVPCLCFAFCYATFFAMIHRGYIFLLYKGYEDLDKTMTNKENPTALQRDMVYCDSPLRFGGGSQEDCDCEIA